MDGYTAPTGGFGITSFGGASNPYGNLTSYNGGSSASGFGGWNGMSTANATGSAAAPTPGSNNATGTNMANPFSAPNAAGGTMPWWNMYQARTAVTQPTQQSYNTGFVPQSQGGSPVPAPQNQQMPYPLPPQFGNQPRFSDANPWETDFTAFRNELANNAMQNGRTAVEQQLQKMGNAFGWNDPRTRDFADRAMGDLRNGTLPGMDQQQFQTQLMNQQLRQMVTAYGFDHPMVQYFMQRQFGNQGQQGQQVNTLPGQAQGTPPPQANAQAASQPALAGSQSPYSYNPKVQAAGDPRMVSEKLSSYTLGTQNGQGLYSAVPAFSARDKEYNPNQQVYNGIIGMRTDDPEYDILYKAYNPETMSHTRGLLENRYSPDQMIKIPKVTRNSYTTGLQAGTPTATENSGLGTLLNLPEVREGHKIYRRGGMVRA